jgi:hypothetical protein
MAREKARLKRQRAAQSFLPRHEGINQFGYGFGGPNPRPVRVWLFVVVVAVIALSGLVFGFFLIPGGLLLLLIYNSINQARLVAVTSSSVVIFRRSLWNAAPKELVGRLPLEVLTAPTAGSGPWMAIGPDGFARTWVTRREYGRLTTSGSRSV